MLVFFTNMPIVNLPVKKIMETIDNLSSNLTILIITQMSRDLMVITILTLVPKVQETLGLIQLKSIVEMLKFFSLL